MKYIKKFEKLKEEIKAGDIVKLIKYNRTYMYQKEIYIGTVRFINDYSMRLDIINTLLYDTQNNLIVIHGSGSMYFPSNSEIKRLKKLSKKDIENINYEIENFKMKKDIKKYNL